MKFRKHHPAGAKRPIRVFYDARQNRFVAGQYYREAGDGQVAVYGIKYDVTLDVLKARLEMEKKFTMPDHAGLTIQEGTSYEGSPPPAQS